MLKKSIAAIALTFCMATSAYAVTKEEADEAVCNARGDLAGAVMIARQKSQDRSEVEKTVSKEMQYLVDRAYVMPVFSSIEEKVAGTVVMNQVEYHNCKEGN